MVQVLQRKFPLAAHLEVCGEKIQRVYFGAGPTSEGIWELDWSLVSPFARLVYEALMDLGVGETATYGEIAKRIGKPKAARAVGAVCRLNPFPLIVPCHRVVAKGGLGGFAYGCTLKKQLLKYEGGENESN